MPTDRVSPAQGHEPLARRVTASVPSVHRSPILFSQFRGPFPMNMAETEEERKKREEEEKAKSNFKKVQEWGEGRDAAAKAAEAENEKLRKEKADRDAADKAAADAKLAEEGKLKELADAKTKEAEAKAAEAAAEKKRADDLAAKVKAFEDQQEAELAEILKTIPDDKKPPMEPSDPVSKRLAIAKYAKSLLGKPDDPLGAGHRSKPDQSKKDRMMELLRKPVRTEEESNELAELSGQAQS